MILGNRQRDRKLAFMKGDLASALTQETAHHRFKSAKMESEAINLQSSEANRAKLRKSYSRSKCDLSSSSSDGSDDNRSNKEKSIRAPSESTSSPTVNKRPSVTLSGFNCTPQRDPPSSSIPSDDPSTTGHDSHTGNATVSGQENVPSRQPGFVDECATSSQAEVKAVSILKKTEDRDSDDGFNVSDDEEDTKKTTVMDLLRQMEQGRNQKKIPVEIRGNHISNRHKKAMQLY